MKVEQVSHQLSDDCEGQPDRRRDRRRAAICDHSYSCGRRLAYLGRYLHRPAHQSERCRCRKTQNSREQERRHIGP